MFFFSDFSFPPSPLRISFHPEAIDFSHAVNALKETSIVVPERQGEVIFDIFQQTARRNFLVSRSAYIEKSFSPIGKWIGGNRALLKPSPVGIIGLFIFIGIAYSGYKLFQNGIVSDSLQNQKKFKPLSFSFQRTEKMNTVQIAPSIPGVPQFIDLPSTTHEIEFQMPPPYQTKEQWKTSGEKEHPLIAPGVKGEPITTPGATKEKANDWRQKRIVETIEQAKSGRIPLSEILTLLRKNFHLLKSNSQKTIKGAGLFNHGTIEELFEGRYENDRSLAPIAGFGRPGSNAMGGLVHAFLHIVPYLNAVSKGVVEEDSLSEDGLSFLDFLESDPLIQLALASYFPTGIDHFRSLLNDGALNDPARRKRWEWILDDLNTPLIQISGLAPYRRPNLER